MRNYAFSIARLVNELMPHYLGGRKLLLFLQGILHPLQLMNDEWAEWAKEKRMEAAMTSQIIVFENFLTIKVYKYLLDDTKKVYITDGSINGLPLYWKSADSVDSPVLRNEDETKGSEAQATLYYQNEQTATSDKSFIVNCPAIDTSLITEDEVRDILTYWVNQYRVAGKTFKVIFY